MPAPSRPDTISIGVGHTRADYQLRPVTRRVMERLAGPRREIREAVMERLACEVQIVNHRALLEEIAKPRYDENGNAVLTEVEPGDVTRLTDRVSELVEQVEGLNDRVQVASLRLVEAVLESDADAGWAEERIPIDEVGRILEAAGIGLTEKQPTGQGD